MQERMLEEARMPARNRRTVMGDALKKALDMRYVRAGEYVNSTLHHDVKGSQENEDPTYRTHDLGRAALGQVRFQPGNHSKRMV